MSTKTKKTKRKSPYYETKTFADFNRKVIQKSEIKWFDRKGLLPFTKNRVIEITLVTGRISGQYEGYSVSIVHKENGTVNSKYFKFNEYLPAPSGGFKDVNKGFKVIAHCGIDWYIDIPSTTEPLEDAIAEYVLMFK